MLTASLSAEVGRGRGCLMPEHAGAYLVLTIHPGSVLGKRTEFRLPPNDPFGVKVGYVNLFKKKTQHQCFLKLYVHFKKIESVKPYGKTLCAVNTMGCKGPGQGYLI